MPHDDQAALFDMLEASERALFAIRGLSEADYDADPVAQAVVERHLITLGEAVKRLSMEFREAHPTVPWRAIAGLRDILVHAYDVIDNDQVYQATTVELPPIVAYLQTLVQARDP
jgi:uncharacterized protein with HEPN domain